MSRTYDILAQHHDWQWSQLLQEISCQGKGCDWRRTLSPTEPGGEAFRQHQADMIDSDARAIEQKRPAHECEDWMIVHPIDKAPYCSGCGSYVA